MTRAIWNGTVLAEADKTLIVEGNHYFPPDSINRAYLSESRLKTPCFWKGLASYYDLSLDGNTCRDAAWYYPHPFIWARRLRNYVAFSYIVRIEQGAVSIPETEAAKPVVTVGGSRFKRKGLPAIRIGILGGLTGILCCVGPTVLAVFGVVSAATAFSWATNLYDNYAWWFRGGGLLLMAGVFALALRKRNQCSIAGARNSRKKIFIALAVATSTYASLYSITTILGNLAIAQ